MEQYIRDEITVLGQVMEERLRANAHKPGWELSPADWLWRRLVGEAHELRIAIDVAELGTMRANLSRSNVERIVTECADVANFAMMIADNVIRASMDKPAETREGEGDAE